MINTEP